MKSFELSAIDVDRVIEMAWEDRTPFEAILFQFGLEESQVIDLMRKELSSQGFKRWRKRVHNRKTKHCRLLDTPLSRFKCSRQRDISFNKVSKR